MSRSESGKDFQSQSLAIAISKHVLALQPPNSHAHSSPHKFAAICCFMQLPFHSKRCRSRSHHISFPNLSKLLSRLCPLGDTKTAAHAGRLAPASSSLPGTAARAAPAAPAPRALAAPPAPAPLAPPMALELGLASARFAMSCCWPFELHTKQLKARIKRNRLQKYTRLATLAVIIWTRK